MDALKNADVPGQQVPDKGGMKSASLKDLCPEDKRRIANLIKELARVSEEKEVTEERLKAEQESFEKKIRQLEEQNELIIKEREALQQQYRECQELLSLYQKYLSEQQEKLTHSLSELEVAKQKEQQMSKERSFHQPPPPLELDGSYRSIARPQPLHKSTRMACGSPSPRSLAQSCKNGHVLGTATPGGRQEEANGFLLENGLRSRCNHGPFPAKQKLPPPSKRTPNVDQRKSTCPLQTCFFHKNLGSPDPDSFQDGCCLPKGCSGPHGGPSAGHSCSPRLLGLSSSADARAQATGSGKRLSEERREQLLLQKMELEIKKERLQNLLAKQEAKLLLQQQQLQQSRLDYNRSKGHHPSSEERLLDDAQMRAGGLAPATSGTGWQLSSSKPSCEGCLSNTPVSGKGCRAPGGLGGSSSGKKRVGFGAQEAGEGFWEHTEEEEEEAVRPRGGMASGSRKDAATSPGLTGGRKECAAAAASPIQRDTSRYEPSLLDLVEAASLGLQPHCSGNRGRGKVLAPPSGSRRKPGWGQSPSGARNGIDDLEEREILEEIFFI